MHFSALLCHQDYAREGLHIVHCVHTSIAPGSEILALVPQIGVHNSAPPLATGGFWETGIHSIGVGIESHIKAAPTLPIVMEGEGKEAAVEVVPVVLMPGDVARAQELRTPQQRMLPPEVDQATTGKRADCLPSNAVSPCWGATANAGENGEHISGAAQVLLLELIRPQQEGLKRV